jgi:hypothetical protein
VRDLIPLMTDLAGRRSDRILEAAILRRLTMNVTVSIPEELYRRATEVAAAENIPVDDLFAVAFEERRGEFECLKEKTSHGSYERFLRVMSKVPGAEPPDYDRL